MFPALTQKSAPRSPQWRNAARFVSLTPWPRRAYSITTQKTRLVDFDLYLVLIHSRFDNHSLTGPIDLNFHPPVAALIQLRRNRQNPPHDCPSKTLQPMRPTRRLHSDHNRIILQTTPFCQSRLSQVHPPPETLEVFWNLKGLSQGTQSPLCPLVRQSSQSAFSTKSFSCPVEPKTLHANGYKNQPLACKSTPISTKHLTVKCNYAIIQLNVTGGLKWQTQSKLNTTKFRQ